jgi:hypothetical protein
MAKAGFRSVVQDVSDAEARAGLGTRATAYGRRVAGPIGSDR